MGGGTAQRQQTRFSPISSRFDSRRSKEFFPMLLRFVDVLRTVANVKLEKYLACKATTLALGPFQPWALKLLLLTNTVFLTGLIYKDKLYLMEGYNHNPEVYDFNSGTWNVGLYTYYAHCRTFINFLLFWASQLLEQLKISMTPSEIDPRPCNIGIARFTLVIILNSFLGLWVHLRYQI